MNKKALSVLMVLLLWTVPAFAESVLLRGWIGEWDVEMKDGSNVIWNIDETWVSATGMTNLAYGIKNPGNEEFMIFYTSMMPGHWYLEMNHTDDPYALPQSFEEHYTELIPSPEPSDEFRSFTAEEGVHPITSGVRKGMEPFPGDPTIPCAASYLLGANNPRLDILRQYRDEQLAATDTGMKMIELYYDRSGEIITLCEKNPILKRSFTRILEAAILVIESRL